MVEQCKPACTAQQWCSAGACSERFQGIRVSWPAQDGALGIEGKIEAQLERTPGAPAEFPTELSFVVATQEGEAVATSTLLHVGDGVFAATWTPPNEGAFVLRIRHDDAGISSEEIRFRGDLERPKLELILPSPERPESTATLSWIDPEPGYEAAWRRDERPVLTLTSDSTDVDPASFTLTVTGVGSDERHPVPVLPAVECAGHACADVQVDLTLPVMRAFRASFSLRATVTDHAGNTTELSRPLRVTRWQWTRRIAPVEQFSRPVIGHGGVLNLASLTSRVLHAVAPDGRELWRKDLGSAPASLFVGGASVGGDIVYALAVSNTGSATTGLTALFAYRGTDGSRQLICSWPSMEWSHLASTKIQLATDSEPVETVMVLLENSVTGAVAYGLARRGATPVCDVKSLGTFPVESFSSIAMSGQTLVTKLGDRLFGFRVKGLPLELIPLFDLPATEFDRLVLTETHAVALFRNVDGRSALHWIRLADGETRVTPTVEGTVAVALGGNGQPIVTANVNGISSVAEHAADGTIAHAAESIPGSYGESSVGAGGHVYATGEAVVTALDPELRTSWSFGLEALHSIQMDCARDTDGKPIPNRAGILYALHSTGSIVSLVVDSSGAAKSPWPVEGRDSRGSRNAAESDACP